MIWKTRIKKKVSHTHMVVTWPPGGYISKGSNNNKNYFEVSLFVCLFFLFFLGHLPFDFFVSSHPVYPLVYVFN